MKSLLQALDWKRISETNVRLAKASLKRIASVNRSYEKMFRERTKKNDRTLT